ncbi:MFS transporter [Kitasatospora sp. NPDC001539]|uniref:MFS transporter n=1 Tax=Kitasatospora sp. NPDC001539 TaxID=3154384 RepID=UPI00331C44B4
MATRQLAAVVVARATSCAGFFSFLPYLGLWLVDTQGLSGGSAGLVVGSSILANRAGAVLLVPLINRLGLKASVVLGYVGAVAVFVALGSGLGLPAIGWLVLATLVGLFLAMATTAMKASVAALPADQRLRGFSYLNMAVNAGSAVGPALGGQLLHWHAGWLPLAAAALHLVALVTATALPGTWRRSERPVPPAKGGGRRWRVQRPFVVFSLLACGTWVAYAQTSDVLPAYLGDTVDARDLGLVFTLNAVMVVALQVPMSWLIRRLLDAPRGGFGALWAAACAVLAASVLLFALGRSTGLGVVLVAMVLFTLAELIWSPLYDAQISERRGTLSLPAAYALAGVASGAAESVGAWLGTFLVVGRSGSGLLSPAASPYWGAAVLALLTGLAMAWDGRSSSADLPDAHEGEGVDHELDVSART